MFGYDGLQQRARNAKTLAGVRIYEEAISTHLAKTGAYPTLSNGCLGINYPSNQCWRGPGGNRSVRSDLDTVLAPYLDNKPEVSTRELRTGASDYRLGAVYVYNSQADAKIIYYLEGANQQCLDGGGGTTEMEATRCQLQLPPNES